MKLKAKKLATLLVIGLIFPLIVNNTIDFSVEQTTFNNPKNSQVLSGGILISASATTNTTYSGNWTWAVSQPWCYLDNGVYIIEDLIINASTSPVGYGIYILDSKNEYFVIRNSTVYDGADGGIKLENTNNGTLTNNNCSSNGGGNGIYLFDSCNNNTLSGNTANDNYIGIYLYLTSANNTISGNTANDNYFGISLEISCENNTISENIANDNDYGIYLYDHSSNNKISGNTANDNNWYGIYLYLTSANNTISGNTANDNYIGISLETSCNNNSISGNTANNNSLGIDIASSHNNTISGNTANDNNRGIDIGSSHNNTITGNTANDNFRGIDIGSSHNNTITGNTANDNDDGISLSESFNNTIKGNTICDNVASGISTGEAVSDNEITENIIYNNTIGIDILGSNHNNLVYKNIFLKNGKHAIDDGTDTKWNSTTIGNYWDNHTGPDVNDDGIVDTQYNISGTPGGIDYLPIAEDGAPSIIINSPDPGDIFDGIAPSFNVRITDDCLDEMWWYTIDGGLNNYTFTANGTIDQTAWEMATKGDVTITFYASDKPGNIGTAEVIIVKDYEAPTININSPTAGVFFASIAPTFNVRITDDYLDIMWYTLDGGLNNYTFTVNGTIDQSAWNAVADGAVILKFYANDTLSNVGSAEVSIIKDATVPIIIINSPGEGDRFGKNAPLFNITISEDNIDSIWYSFDGGVTTNAITDGTIFNQTAWTALSQGEVTITFYARDLAGNEASESVTVIKSVPSGLEPGVIITIVVISIVGGVAVIAGVYVFMKKRAAPA